MASSGRSVLVEAIGVVADAGGGETVGVEEIGVTTDTVATAPEFELTVVSAKAGAAARARPMADKLARVLSDNMTLFSCGER